VTRLFLNSSLCRALFSLFILDLDRGYQQTHVVLLPQAIGDTMDEPRLNPTAPPFQSCANESSSPTSLSLDRLLKENAIDAFRNSMDFIFQHASADVKKVLSTVPMTELRSIRQELFDKLCCKFPAMKDNRLINRTSLPLLQSDVYTLGYCVINGAQSLDLMKIVKKNHERRINNNDEELDGDEALDTDQERNCRKSQTL
jgi:hypothetical protein